MYNFSLFINYKKVTNQLFKMQFLKSLKNFSRDNSGVTGLETAIILIAFVVVAAVFAFTVMTTGLFSTEKAKTTSQAALTEASSSFILKGSVTATCAAGAGPLGCKKDLAPVGVADEYVDSITFTIALAIGAEQQRIDDESVFAIHYFDENNDFRTSGDVPRQGIVTAVAITEVITGSIPGVLEGGDSATVTVSLNLNTGKGGGAKPIDDVIHLGAGQKFRIEIISPKGGTLVVERTLPKNLTRNMNLQ